MITRISTIAALIAAVLVFGCSTKHDDDALPQIVHVASECPNGKMTLQFDDGQADFSFTKTDDGMTWNDFMGSGKSIAIDGRLRVATNGSGKQYIAGCQDGGVRLFLKDSGGSVQHIFLMPSRNGYDADINFDGKHVRGHGRKLR